MSTAVDKQATVGVVSGMAYAAPVVPLLVLMSSSTVLSGIYATHHGLPLVEISMVMLLVGLFDAITDPSIGYVSDRYYAKTGSRRPFAIAGAALLIPSAWFLLSPGEGVTATYFLLWYVMFYLSVTLFQIPHLTWGGEISPVAEEKTKVYGYRNYAAYVGMILFMLIPMLPFNEGTQVTPETLRWSVIVAGVLFIPTLYVMYRYVPLSVHRTHQNKPKKNILRALSTLRHNKPFLWLLIAGTVYSMGASFFNGLYFMMVDMYLGLGDYYVHILLFQLIVASVAIKPVVSMIAKIGKMNAWIVAIVLSMLAYILLPVVLLNSAYSLYLLYLFNTIFALYSAITNIVIYSLLSDVSDYGTFKSGTDHSAVYFSFQSLASKTSLAVGIALTIGLAGLLGFDPSAETHGTEIYWVLCLCMSVIPLVLSLAALFFIPGIAITSRRHAVIRRRLEARAKRADQTAVNNKPLCEKMI